MGQLAIARLGGGAPSFDQRTLDAPERLLLGDARVGDAVEPALEQLDLLLRAQVAVVGDADVVLVRDEVEEVLLEVGAGAADRVDLVAPDHLGQRPPELAGGHGPGQRDEHPPAPREVLLVAAGGVDRRGCVEVAVVLEHEVADVHGRLREAGSIGGTALQSRVHGRLSTALESRATMAGGD